MLQVANARPPSGSPPPVLVGIPTDTPRLSCSNEQRQNLNAMLEVITNEELFNIVKNPLWWGEKQREMDPTTYCFLVDTAKYYLAPQALGRTNNFGKPLADTYVISLVEGIVAFDRWLKSVTE